MSQVITSAVALPTLAAIRTGLLSLRAAQVEPMGLCLRVGTTGRLGWHWYKFKALPGHPLPENAGRGYSHPVYVAGRPFESQALYLSANGHRDGAALSTDAAEGMTDQDVADAVASPILDACGLDWHAWHITLGRYVGPCQVDVRRYEFGEHIPEVIGGNLATVDLTRGGVEPWAEYPDVGLQQDVEEVADGEGGMFRALRWGGKAERRRARASQRRERLTTDAYMAGAA